MTKFAKALTTTVDFLLNETADIVVENAGLKKELISRFIQVQSLETDDKKNGTIIDKYLNYLNKNSNIIPR